MLSLPMNGAIDCLMIALTMRVDLEPLDDEHRDSRKAV